MALPTGTSLSLAQVRTELGLSGPISLGDADVRALAGKPTGPISLNDLRGKSAEYKVVINFATWILTGVKYNVNFVGYAAANMTTNQSTPQGSASPDNYNGIPILEANTDMFGYMKFSLLGDHTNSAPFNKVIFRTNMGDFEYVYSEAIEQVQAGENNTYYYNADGFQGAPFHTKFALNTLERLNADQLTSLELIFS